MNQAVSLEHHPEFALIERVQVDALKAQVSVCEHKKTGARHYHLATDSSENSFMVAFRTQPMDSRGTAHILEHTALCGSARYPVRDPFFTMLKRSLQTFMNAFTSSDWTAYPFATQNPADFDNLLSVYLDAAFFPTLHPLDFAQEGIRVAFGDEGSLEYRGIVFNEMKGAMSGEMDQLFQAISKHLHPVTTYHFNSGGDPAQIPNLTHADLVKFHAAHYHPSNAVFMSFGNKDLTELQTQLHELALKNFEQGPVFTSVPEARLQAPVAAVEPYAVDEIKPNQTHHVVAWLLPTMTDIRLRLALSVLEEVLLGHSAAPLKQFIDQYPHSDSASRLLGLDDSHYEMAFYAGIKGSNPEHAEQFETDLLAKLEELASQPFDSDAVTGALQQIELSERHIGGDGMPYGLTLLLNALPSAIHHGDAAATWQIDPLLEWLKGELKDPEFLPGLIRTHLLDNTHRVRLSLVPDATLADQQAEAEKSRLQGMQERLSDAGASAIRELTASLNERQSQIDDLSLLPKVNLSDVPLKQSYPEEQQLSVTLNQEPATAHVHRAGTNGIYYVQLALEASDELLAQAELSLLLSAMGEMGTTQHSRAEFQTLQSLHGGGVSASIARRTSLSDPQSFKAYLTLTTHALETDTKALDLLAECLLHTEFTETRRLLEMLKSKKGRWATGIVSSGHQVALQIASAPYSKLARLQLQTAGPAELIKLDQQIKMLEQDGLEPLAEQLTQLHAAITGLDKHLIMVSEEAVSSSLLNSVAQAFDQPVTQGAELAVSDLAESVELSHDHNAWVCATNVQHWARSFKAVPASHADAPALMILGSYLRNNYLHQQIRESGGAYGGGAKYDSNSCSFNFFSYRDPRLEATLGVFSASVEWMLSAEHESHWLEESILGVIAALDKPGSPAGEAVSTSMSSLFGRTPEVRAAFRASVLNVTVDDLLRVTRSYLVDQPFRDAVIAPFAQAEHLKSLGFHVQKLDV